MAIADPAQRAGDCCELAKMRQRRIRLPSLAARRLTIFAVACAVGLAGCARNPNQRDFNPVQREARVAPVCKPARPRPRVYTAAPRQAEAPVHRPDPALLEPQTAPSCEYKRADIKTVDPDEWARLKTEYERQCYQDAEKAVRNRLSQLQDAVR